MATSRPCKDCEPGAKRPAPHPGPRCATHHRAELARRRVAARDKRIEQTYGLAPDEYDALLALQGGRCAICQRATGKTRRLAVDHDHAQAVLDGHDEDKGCQSCTRGLLCRPCNRMLGHLRDDLETAQRIVQYLHWPPYRDLATGSARSASATSGSESAGPTGSSASGAVASATSGPRT